MKASSLILPILCVASFFAWDFAHADRDRGGGGDRGRGGGGGRAEARETRGRGPGVDRGAEKRASRAEDRSRGAVSRDIRNDQFRGGFEKDIKDSRGSFRDDRTPSMSRGVKNRAPTSGELKEFVKGSPSEGNRSKTRADVTGFLKKGHDSGNKAAVKELKKGFPERSNQNRQVASNIQRSFHTNHPNHTNWFSDSFFHSHHFQPTFHYNGARWWRGTPWLGINSWLGWGWGYPVYYGDGGYYYNDQSYQQTNVYPPAETTPYAAPSPSMSQIYEQPLPTLPNATAVQNTPPASADWLPLGVFAASKNIDQAAHSTMIVQLALSKDGDIAGTYYNTSLDQVHPLEGVVDKETQEVAWKVSDDPNSPVMTTTIYSLTEDVVNVEVNFPNGTKQPWILVRLNQ